MEKASHFSIQETKESLRTLAGRLLPLLRPLLKFGPRHPSPRFHSQIRNLVAQNDQNVWIKTMSLESVTDCTFGSV